MQHIAKREYMEALAGQNSGWIIRSMLDATPYMNKTHLKLHKVALKRLFRSEPHDVADNVLSALAYHINTDDVSCMRSSARICLQDAQACFERRDYQHAIERAARGFEYLGYISTTRG